MTEPETPDRLIAEFAFEAWATLAEPVTIGPSKYGERGVIPITGGHFQGPMLHGEVLSGGADWQLTRTDGVLEIDARYPIRCSDGTLIQVRNRGIVVIPPLTEPFGQKLYVRTVPEFEAPLASPHAWLNRSIFVGKLRLDGPGRVHVRVYRLT